MPNFSLVPVDHRPDFDDYSLVPVDHDPFAADGVTQLAQFQQPPTPTQPAQPQPQTQLQQSATGAGQPGVNGRRLAATPADRVASPASAMQEAIQTTRLGLKAGRSSPAPSAEIRHQRSP